MSTEYIHRTKCEVKCQVPIRFRKDLKKMKPFSEVFYEYKVRLNANECPFDFPFKLKEIAMKRLLDVDFNRYPAQHMDEFRNSLASHLGVEPQMIVLGNGLDEIISLCVKAFGVGGKVIAPVPTFDSYEGCAIAQGVQFVGVPLLDGFQLDVAALIRETNLPSQAFDPSCDTGPLGILFLCNPNNPTGNSFPMSEIESIVKSSQMVVAIDEAYWDFAENNAFYMLKKYPHVIIMRTFSKSYGLAGVRVGYAVTSPELAYEINKVRDAFNMNSLSLTVAQVALENQEYRQDIIEYTMKERNRLFEGLLRIKGIEPFRSDTNFILFRTEKPAETVMEGLKSRSGIGIRSYSHKPSLKNCLRVSVGTPEENSLFLEEIRRIMEQ